MNPYQPEIEEGERQMIILALAELALSRPGWDWTIGETVKKFGGENATTMWTGFKGTSADRVKCSHDPLLRKRADSWLIEKTLNGTLFYLTADVDGLVWTSDLQQALRLSRREDAELLCKIVEDADRIIEYHERLA